MLVASVALSMGLEHRRCSVNLGPMNSFNSLIVYQVFIQHMFLEPLHELGTVLGTRVWNFCYLTLLGAKERV